MPIKSENKKLYPPNWKEISLFIRTIRAENKCEFCGAINYEPHPETKSRVVLTVAHLDHNPSNCDHANLKALCQRCHLRYDAKHHAKNAKISRERKIYRNQPDLNMCKILDTK